MYKELVERFYCWLCWKLPKHLVTWCYSRIVAYYSTQVHPDQKMEDAILNILDTWTKQPKY